MTSHRALTAALTIAALTTSAFTTSVATAQSSNKPLVVEQGDATVLGYFVGDTCTIAYNDHEKNVSYVAGHCGGKGTPTKISLRDSRSKYDAYINVGYFFPGSKTDWEYPGTNDWGYIRWNSKVTLGENVITGDAKFDPRNLQPKDKICRFGQTSIRDKTQSSCGEFSYLNPDGAFFLYTSKIPSNKGDSGGPVWLERDGKRFFLGPHSGPGQYYDQDDNLRDAFRGSIIDYSYTHPNDTGNVDNQTSSTTSSTGSSYDVINSSQENGEEISSFTASKVWLLMATIVLGIALSVFK